RAARGDLEDARPELDAAGPGGQPGEHRRGVGTVRLGRPDRVVAERLGGLGDVELVGGREAEAPVADAHAQLHDPKKVWYRRNTFNVMIIVATPYAPRLVQRLFTRLPISFLSRVK